MDRYEKLALLTGLAVSVLNPFPQGTAFTYQGRLYDNGNPANGIYDLRFTIYDAAGGSNVIAGPLTNSAIAVTNGLFTVMLDFGASVFPGPDRWQEIGVSVARRRFYDADASPTDHRDALYCASVGGQQRS